MTVLMAQVGAMGLALAIAGALLLLLALAFAARLPPKAGMVAAVAGILVALVPAVLPGAAKGPVAGDDFAWQPFDPAAIPGLVKQGKVVLVDVTADWCVTCIVNKQLVLDVGASRTRFQQPDVVLMKADWTRPDDAIARYLASFGRYGIPFNVVYGPAVPNGVLLPELLSEVAVLDAFARAAGS
jgi:suppressor for copper-sensitivity B